MSEYRPRPRDYVLVAVIVLIMAVTLWLEAGGLP